MVGLPLSLILGFCEYFLFLCLEKALAGAQ